MEVMGGNITPLFLFSYTAPNLSHRQQRKPAVGASI